MNGAQLTRKIMQHIKDVHGGFPVNVISAGVKGIPDLLVCINSEFYAFEVKGKNDQEKELQSAQLTRIAEAGGYGGYVRDLDDVDNIIANRIRFVQINPVKRLKL